MQTVNQFLGRLWYTTEIVIVPYNHVPIDTPDIDSFKKIALWNGSVNSTRSCLAIQTLQRYVKSYGIVDNTLIIEILED